MSKIVDWDSRRWAVSNLIDLQTVVGVVNRNVGLRSHVAAIAIF
jgi:hypothetical protein